MNPLETKVLILKRLAKRQRRQLRNNVQAAEQVQARYDKLAIRYDKLLEVVKANKGGEPVEERLRHSYERAMEYVTRNRPKTGTIVSAYLEPSVVEGLVVRWRATKLADEIYTLEYVDEYIF